jgi:hypothetical protein
VVIQVIINNPTDVFTESNQPFCIFTVFELRAGLRAMPNSDVWRFFLWAVVVEIKCDYRPDTRARISQQEPNHVFE